MSCCPKIMGFSSQTIDLRLILVAIPILFLIIHEHSIFCLLEISFLHICPIWFIINTYWEQWWVVDFFIYEYSRIFNLLLWKKINIQFLYENVLLLKNNGFFIPNYRFTIDTCCDTNFILDNSWIFNLLLEKEKL
jgi:hypothetical protein